MKLEPGIQVSLMSRTPVNVAYYLFRFSHMLPAEIKLTGRTYDMA